MIRTIKALLFAFLVLATGSTTRAHDATYSVNVNTSSIAGTSGSLDFQFDPGPIGSQLADLKIQGFSSDGTLGSPSPTGDVTGTLPGTLAFDNGTSFNDYFTGFTFGTTISFDVTLFGPAVSSPNGTSSSGTSFFFSMFSDPNGFNPALTTNSVTGVAAELDVNLDGSTAPTNSSGELTLEHVPTVPEPGACIMLGFGLPLLVTVRRLWQRETI